MTIRRQLGGGVGGVQSPIGDFMRYRRMAEPYHTIDGQLITWRGGGAVHVGEVLNEPGGRRASTLCGIAVAVNELEAGGGDAVTCAHCRERLEQGHG